MWTRVECAWWLAAAAGLPLLVAACTNSKAEMQLQRDLAALRQDIHATNLTVNAQKAQTDRQIQEAMSRRLEEDGRGRTALAAQLQELLTEVRLMQGRLEEGARAMGETNRRVDLLAERVDETSNRVAGLGTHLVSLEGLLQAQQERVEQLGRPAAGSTPPGAAAAETPPARSMSLAPAERQIEGRPPAESADQVYRTALTDFTRQHFDQALRGFQVFLQTFPQDSRVPDAQYWLGESYRGQGNYGQAAMEFEAFVKKYPDSPKLATAKVRHGEALVLSGDKGGCAVLQEARTQFPRARAGALAKDLMAQHCS